VAIKSTFWCLPASLILWNAVLFSRDCWRPRRWVDSFTLTLSRSRWQQGTELSVAGFGFPAHLLRVCPSFRFGASFSNAAVWLRLLIPFALLLADEFLLFMALPSSQRFLKQWVAIVVPHISYDRLPTRGRNIGFAGVEALGGKLEWATAQKPFLPRGALSKHILIWKTDRAMGLISVRVTCLWIRPVVSHDFGLSSRIFTGWIPELLLKDSSGSLV